MSILHERLCLNHVLTPLLSPAVSILFISEELLLLAQTHLKEVALALAGQRTAVELPASVVPLFIHHAQHAGTTVRGTARDSGRRRLAFLLPFVWSDAGDVRTGISVCMC